MLYPLVECQRAALAPVATWARAAAQTWGAVSGWGVALAPSLSAHYALLHRLTKAYEKPAFGLHHTLVHGRSVAVHECSSIELPFCRLLHFARTSDDPATQNVLNRQPALLIVAPLSGHHATLLRETVRTLLPEHQVYITDWIDARQVPTPAGHLTLDGYVCAVQTFLRHLHSVHGHSHVLGVCQSAVPVLAAVSLLASRGEPTPASMLLMGGPIDARQSPNRVNTWVRQQPLGWIEHCAVMPVPSQYPGAGRRVVPGFMQHLGFLALNPALHAQRHGDYFQSLARGDCAGVQEHQTFYDEFNAVLDMDAPYYLQTLQVVFQDFSLARGQWQVRSANGTLELVRPQDIRHTALLTLEGELDDISGAGQTQAAHALCWGVPEPMRQHCCIAGVGHFGLFSGSRWRETIAPRIGAFIQSRHAE